MAFSQNEPLVRVLNGTDVLANTSGTNNQFISSAGGRVLLTDSAGTFFDFNFKTRDSIAITRSTAESIQVDRVSFTAANSTEYSFVITQDVDEPGGDGLVQIPISFTSDASGTNAEIEAGLKSIIDAHVSAGRLKVSVAVTGGGAIDISGLAGYPLFSVGSLSNVTRAANQPVIAPHGTPSTAIAGTTTVTVTSLAAHGLVVGDRVDISGVATMTLTYEGTAGLAAVSNVRVATVPTSTTFTLEGVVATGTNSGTIVITDVATERSGQGADLVATETNMIGTESAQSTVFGTSDAYTLVSLKGFISKGNGGMNQNLGEQLQELRIWIEEDATNYAGSVGRADEVRQGFVQGGTTADPNLI